MILIVITNELVLEKKKKGKKRPLNFPVLVDREV